MSCFHNIYFLQRKARYMPIAKLNSSKGLKVCQIFTFPTCGIFFHKINSIENCLHKKTVRLSRFFGERNRKKITTHNLVAFVVLLIVTVD